MGNGRERPASRVAKHPVLRLKMTFRCTSTVIKPSSHALPRSVGTGHMYMYAFVPRERSENSWEADPSESLVFSSSQLIQSIQSQASLCSPPCEMTQIFGNHNFLNVNLIRISRWVGVWQVSSSRLVGQCWVSSLPPLSSPFIVSPPELGSTSRKQIVGSRGSVLACFSLRWV